MKIVATPLPAGNPITLGDDRAGDFVIDPPPLPVERREIQIESLAFAERQFATGRGNRATSFSWVVARRHADQQTADGFVWGHAAAVPLNCAIQIQDAGGTWNFTSAVIVEVAVLEQTGVSTKVRYSVRGAVREG